MKKKLIGLALSAAMLFSVLSVSAFAAVPEESADPALTTEQTAAEEENCFFTSSSTEEEKEPNSCLLYTSPSPRDPKTSRMPSSA